MFLEEVKACCFEYAKEKCQDRVFPFLNEVFFLKSYNFRGWRSWPKWRWYESLSRHTTEYCRTARLWCEQTSRERGWQWTHKRIFDTRKSAWGRLFWSQVVMLNLLFWLNLFFCYNMTVTLLWLISTKRSHILKKNLQLKLQVCWNLYDILVKTKH